MKKYKDLFITLLTFLIYFVFSLIFNYILKLLHVDIKSSGPFLRNFLLILECVILLTIVFIIYRKSIIKDFKKYIDNKGKWFVKYVGIFVGSVLLMGILNIILSKITGLETSNNEQAVRKYIEMYPVFMAFSTVIYAPFIEELLFRKGIRNIINGNDKYTKALFVIISAIIFGLIHVITVEASFYELLMSIPYMVVGLSLGYIYIKTENVFACIQFHLMHNTILILLRLLMRG